jgi:non-ribosomal peptide synthetase-like protein
LIFAGTPMKALVLRALGVRVGRRLLDDGSAIPEHTLTALGDAVTLNSGATIQRHSPEDGAFKSDRTEIGDGATVGVPAFVHYGVTMGPGSCWTRTRS